MKPIIKKLLHEFWLAKGKFLLCVLATAIAGWGVSTVTYSYLMAERDFHENFGSTQSADITLTIENYSTEIEQLLRSDNQVADLERREMAIGRIMNNKGIWMSVILFGVDDWNNQKMDVFRVTEKKEGLNNAILIEQNANDFLDYFSDSAQMQFLPQINDFKLVKGGIVHDPRQAPAQMERVVYGYASISSIQSLLTPGKVRMLVRVKNATPTKESFEEVASRLAGLVAGKGARVTSVNVPTPGEHIHQPIIDGISFLQQSFGLILVILGITLLSLILLTWLFPQLVQVGIIKALGASSRQIYVGYMVVLGIVITTGLLIGLPLGMKSAEMFNRFISIVQNFRVFKDPFPIYVHLLVGAASSVFPFLFGIIPVDKTARITVREALSTTFHSANMSLIKWFQKIFVTATSKYGGSNLLRSGLRTYLLIALLGVGLALFFTGTNLSYSFYRDFSDYYKSSPYQITISLSDTTSKNVSFIEKLPSVNATALLISRRMSYRVPDLGREESALVRILPNNYIVNESRILQGELIRSCSDCVFIHPAMVERGFKTAKIGDVITLTGRNGDSLQLRYTGVFKEMGGVHGGGMLFYFTTKPNKTFSQIGVQLKPNVPIPQALKELEASLKQNNISYTSLSDVDTNFEGSYNHFKPTYYIVQGMGLFTIVVAFLGMLIVLNLTIQERTLEIGILKAMGGSYTNISNILTFEFLVISVISLGIGVLVSTGLSDYFCGMFGEMVRGQAIPGLINIKVMVITAATLLIIQVVLIKWYCKSRIEKTSNALLNFVG